MLICSTVLSMRACVGAERAGHEMWCGAASGVERGVSEQNDLFAGSRLTDAGQQPPHYLPVRIATGRDSLHRLLSEGLGLLFGLSLVLRKRHPFADDFSPCLVFRLHAQSFALNGGRRRIKAASGASGHSVLLSMI